MLSTFWQPLFPGWYSIGCSCWSPASAFSVDGEFITFQFLFSNRTFQRIPAVVFPQEAAILFFSIKFRTEKTKQMELLPIVHLLHSLHTCMKQGGKEGTCWGCKTEISKRGRKLSALRSILPDDRIHREVKVPGQSTGVWA